MQERWVEDGTFITSGGVSVGIDMALYLVSKLTDEATARRVRLALDYDPQPPFGGKAQVPYAVGTAGTCTCPAAQSESIVEEAGGVPQRAVGAPSCSGHFT